ncbi:unnamed protein product [Toxocara canis]|uniref:MSP domain-containing protein n=1 Tax=Toxocara canis TaxID=6265 RepID=A0A183U2A5_TOXCA|nr:unnamed protein product [Toxocara canis]
MTEDVEVQVPVSRWPPAQSRVSRAEFVMLGKPYKISIKIQNRDLLEDSNGMNANEPCSSMMSQGVLMNHNGYQTDIYNSNTEYGDNNLLSPQYSQQVFPCCILDGRRA